MDQGRELVELPKRFIKVSLSRPLSLASCLVGFDVSSCFVCALALLSLSAVPCIDAIQSRDQTADTLLNRKDINSLTAARNQTRKVLSLCQICLLLSLSNRGSDRVPSYLLCRRCRFRDNGNNRFRVRLASVLHSQVLR